MSGHSITLDTVNPCIQHIAYVGQGPMVVRSREIEKELKEGVVKPYKTLIKATLGDCQAMGQAPITFIREVVALISCPRLLDDPQFAPDVKERAREFLAWCEGGSVGAYSDKRGIEMVRRHVAEFIERRDGVPSDFRNVIVTGGSVDAIKSVMKLVNSRVDGKLPGVLAPIPQYPLYSSTCTEIGMHQIGYYLNEEQGWSVDVSELQRAIDDARELCTPRLLVVINPGNPTGQVLTRENVEQVIRFAHANHLVILADEVYQVNVYAEGSAFHSFKRVAFEMGGPFANMEIASVLSCSKGVFGECGFRASYVEFANLLPEILALYYNLLTIVSGPSIVGQAVLDCVVRPPKKGDPSYERFRQECDDVLRSLAERAQTVTAALNAMEGVSCQTVQGAFYAFPKLTLPARLVAEAESLGRTPDDWYCTQLIERTGICFLPGSGFHQKPGTHHFRTTILSQPEQMRVLLEKLAAFHAKILDEYR